MTLSTQQLNDYFEYDPLKGQLFWKTPTNTRIVKGSVAGTADVSGRVRVKLNKKLYFAHKIIWTIVTGDWPKSFIDHVDQNPANNRFENLRLCNKRQNSQNRKPQKNCSSSYHGVSWNKLQKKWHSQAFFEGKKHHLGYYKDEVEAAKAYDTFAKSNFKEFASLNFKEFA